MSRARHGHTDGMADNDKIERDELEAQEAELLAERQAMSVIRAPGETMPPVLDDANLQPGDL